MKEFERYHPVVNFSYFATAVGFTMFFMHPVTVGISFICALSYSAVLGGKKAALYNIFLLIPLMLITALLNPLISSEGSTVIAYLWNIKPVTMEAVLFGLASAGMIGSVVCYFSSFNKIMSSDKTVYLFGRVLPTLSLVLSMILRIVPGYKSQLENAINAQKAIGKANSWKAAIKILFSTLNQSLENAIDTADSMKSRGYGLQGRTTFTDCRFYRRDTKALVLIITLSIYVIVGAVKGIFNCKYYPQLSLSVTSFYGISVFIAYGLLLSIPIIIECWEALRWKALKSKI